MATENQGKEMSKDDKKIIDIYIKNLHAGRYIWPLYDIFDEVGYDSNGQPKIDSPDGYKKIIGLVASTGRFDLCKGFLFFMPIGWDVRLDDGEDGEKLVVVTDLEGKEEVYGRIAKGKKIKGI